jgi:hypothetical protein
LQQARARQAVTLSCALALAQTLLETFRSQLQTPLTWLVRPLASVAAASPFMVAMLKRSVGASKFPRELFRCDLALERILSLALFQRQLHMPLGLAIAEVFYSPLGAPAPAVAACRYPRAQPHRLVLLAFPWETTRQLVCLLLRVLAVAVHAVAVCRCLLAAGPPFVFVPGKLIACKAAHWA